MRRRDVLRLLAGALCLGPGAARATESSNFARVYGDPVLRDAFFLFLQNVFNLVPEDRFHQLITEMVAAHDGDRAIFEGIAAGLPGITPFASSLTYAWPALRKQKREMGRQAVACLDGIDRVDGYLEVGTTGRYVRPLGDRVELVGPVFIVNDLAPTYGPVDVLERGGLRQVGDFVPLGDYDPVTRGVPEGSLDLVTNFIGFHHCPPDRLDDFVTSLRAVLRPGGRLLVREHDVVDGTMDTFVALAHDVFNAGVGRTWQENADELRHFRSVADWTLALEAHGFARRGGRQLQDHDPTDNAVLTFTKV